MSAGNNKLNTTAKKCKVIYIIIRTFEFHPQTNKVNYFIWLLQNTVKHHRKEPLSIFEVGGCGPVGLFHQI